MQIEFFIVRRRSVAVVFYRKLNFIALVARIKFKGLRIVEIHVQPVIILHIDLERITVFDEIDYFR